MIGYLVHRFSHAAHDAQVRADGGFHVSLNERFHHAPLDLEEQDEALLSLHRRGYVKIARNPSSGKRFYKLAIDKLLRDMRED